MNSDETSVQFSQDMTSTSSIPSIVERWCLDSEPIKGGIAEMYAIYGAVAPISAQSIGHTDEIGDITVS